MASRSLEYATSPFENVFNFLGSLPQGHEKAVKHALYNALALFLLIVASAAGYGLFIILGPFIKPLIWALLIGSVLHPFKHSLATTIQSWLKSLESSSRFLLIGVLMVPVNLVDDISEKIGGQLTRHFKILAALIITALVLHLLYFYTPHFCICIIWRLGLFSNAALSWFISHISTTVVVSLVIGYLILLALCWSPQNSRQFAYASCLVWMMVACYVANMAYSFQVSVFFVIQALFLAGFFVQVWHVHGQMKADGKEVPFTEAVKEALKENVEEHVPGTAGGSQVEEVALVEQQADEQESDNIQRERGETSLQQQNVRQQSQLHLETTEKDSSESDMYIYGVIYGCVAMLLYKYSLFLQLCPIPIFIYMVKHLGRYLGVWSLLGDQLTVMKNHFTEWCNRRSSALFPVPIVGLFKLGAKINSKLMESLNGSVDSAASVVVILGITLFAVTTTILLAVQVYAEGIHLVYMGASAINSTVVRNSDVLGVVPEDWQDKMNSILDNAYMYGRDGISKMVRGWMKNVDDQKAVELEKQILDIWDRVYQAMVMSSEKTSGPVVTKEAVFASWDSFLDGVQKTPEVFNVNAMIGFAKENVETLMSVLESLWSILKDNMSLALYSCTALLSIVFGGGTAVLNFILDMVVFLTALFYLLSSSGQLYKPVELITNFSPNMGNRFATAIETAVIGVFRASFKMAVFYGLWTWLIHNLFDCKIIYLPSVLAATFSVVPFLGTYWACLPACLDLWLGQQRGWMALLLFGFQFFPMSVVDTAIYKEIKGGGHPYLTGLSIAGGIFCLGAEGAIVGPLLLCGLFVAINMSTSLMKESPSETNFPSLNRMTLGERISHLNQLKRMDTVI